MASVSPREVSKFAQVCLLSLENSGAGGGHQMHYNVVGNADYEIIPRILEDLRMTCQ